MNKEQEKEKIVKEIFETFEGGGSFAHNIIRMNLTILSGIDKELADKTYSELQDMGY